MYGSRKLFLGYLIGFRNRKTSASSNQLMLCPFFFKIIETTPERC